MIRFRNLTCISCVEEATASHGQTYGRILPGMPDPCHLWRDGQGQSWLTPLDNDYRHHYPTGCEVWTGGERTEQTSFTSQGRRWRAWGGSSRRWGEGNKISWRAAPHHPSEDYDWGWTSSIGDNVMRGHGNELLSLQIHVFTKQLLVYTRSGELTLSQRQLQWWWNQGASFRSVQPHQFWNSRRSSDWGRSRR